MSNWLKELLTIYTWKEFWIAVSIPTVILGVWFLFTYLLSIPNNLIRATAIWSLIFSLTFASETVRTLKKSKEKP